MGIGWGGISVQEMAAGMKGRGYVCPKRLGEGAFSEVYRVEDMNGKLCACKVSGNVRLLEREAQVMRELAHPLFPEFLEFWSHEGLGYLAMEYVAGTCLESVLKRRGGFCAGQVIRMGMELAEGLLYLHGREGSYLFRDVKPANIILRQDGRVKLLDFGCICARGEERGSRAGTPGYGAPEQLEGNAALTEACDVYGLGRTLQEALEGEKGRGAGSGRGPAQRMGGGRLSIPDGKGRREQRRRRELGRLLEACTRREPARRIADMRDVMAALLELEGGGAWRGQALCRKNIWDSMYKTSCSL